MAADAGMVESRIEDHGAMAAIGHPIIDDELAHDGNRHGKAIGNRFRNIGAAAAPHDALARRVTIGR